MKEYGITYQAVPPISNLFRGFQLPMLQTPTPTIIIPRWGCTSFSVASGAITEYGDRRNKQ
jgi:hypothetical protein